MTAENQNTAQDQDARGVRKTRVGVVVSDKSDKTVVVKVERRFAHPLYGKQVTRTKKYHAHDEKNEYHVGDTVRITETRPLSKLKRWRVSELIERAR
jgi:small subunit ribosomal protein S17